MLQIDPPTVSAAVATIAAAATVFTYFLNRKLQPYAPAAKLMDRMYELNKLVLQYPAEFAAFMKEATRKDAYFYAPESVVARDATYFRLKSFAYFHLDFFEEVYLAIQDKSVSEQFEGEQWMDYILQKMRHPLLREVFHQEADRIYKGAFADYIRSKANEISQPCDPMTW